MTITQTRPLGNRGWTLEIRYNDSRTVYKIRFNNSYLPDTFYSLDKAMAHALELGIVEEANS
jgi:hypothetical protein